MLTNYNHSLNTFFVELRDIMRVEALTYAVTYKKMLETFFYDISFKLTLYNQFKKQSDKYLSGDFNVLDYISPDENRLSDIIGDLFDRNGTHGQADLFINLFFEYLISNEKLNIPMGEYKVQREVYANGRIDIYLESDSFAIIIENKPFAPDQKDQLKRYYGEIVRRYKHRMAIIYLNKNRDNPSSYSIDENTLQMMYERKMFSVLSYHDFKEEVLKPCFQKCESNKFRYFLGDLMDYIERHPSFTHYTGVGG